MNKISMIANIASLSYIFIFYIFVKLMNILVWDNIRDTPLFLDIPETISILYSFALIYLFFLGFLKINIYISDMFRNKERNKRNNVAGINAAAKLFH